MRDAVCRRDVLNRHRAYVLRLEGEVNFLTDQCHTIRPHIGAQVRVDLRIGHIEHRFGPIR